MLYENSQRLVRVYFERPTQNGFDFAEAVLPQCMITKTSGFSENELFEITDYLKANSVLIWDYSQHRGQEHA
jgi:hypothetical protein